MIDRIDGVPPEYWEGEPRVEEATPSLPQREHQEAPAEVDEHDAIGGHRFEPDRPSGEDDDRVEPWLFEFEPEQEVE